MKIKLRGMNYRTHTCITIILCLVIGTAFSQIPGASSAKDFKKHILTVDFYSEGVAVADLNNDGKKDIVAGPLWFEAPAWKRHEIYPDKPHEVKTSYSTSFLNFTLDVDQDGWVDVLVQDFPGLAAYWYKNPGKKGGYWEKHVAFPTVANESPAFADVDGDGREDLICADAESKQMAWIKSPSAKGDTTWTRYPISEPNPPGTDIFSHGLGFGDINGDGRKDLIIRSGWWEAPVDPKQPNWKYHPADIGEDCAQMYTLDVNKDGKADVLSSSAHRYGIWWNEQGKDEYGHETWGHNLISFVTSQTHSLSLADLNGDGHVDMITGKRYFAHLEHKNPSNSSTIDPGSYGKPAIYWFEYLPGKGPFWKEHEIDPESGVGINTVAEDMNGDGMPDIVVANKNGVFFFENLMKKK